MDGDLINSMALLITGATIPIITSYLNNKYQVRRDIMKYDNEREIEKEKREFDEAKNNRIYLIQNIEKVNGLLSYFEHSISLTSSVINSSNNMKTEEFDLIYRKELEQLISLKSIIIARFPDFYCNILRIDGYHNNYWGNQRLLLHIDINKDKEGYLALQREITEIANKTSSEIYELSNTLRNYSEKINISMPTNKV